MYQKYFKKCRIGNILNKDYRASLKHVKTKQKTKFYLLKVLLFIVLFLVHYQLQDLDNDKIKSALKIFE